MDGGGAPETVTLDGLGRLARRLLGDLAPGSVVWLSGDLGAGKTTFVQAVTAAAGAQRATSPSFALVHEYHSPDGMIAHADCYRLRDPAEAIDLDLPGLARSARLLLIEWPEKAGRLAPRPDTHLRFSHVADPDRRLVERLA